MKFFINAQGGGYWGIGDSANTIHLIKFDDSLNIIMDRLFTDTATVTVSFLKQEANSHLLIGGNSSNYLDGFLLEMDTNANVLYSLYPHNNQRIRSAAISPQNDLYVLISYDSVWNEMRFITKLNPSRQVNWTIRSDHVLYSENPVSCEFVNDLLYVFSNNPDGSDLKMRVETFDSLGFGLGTTEWAFGAPGVPDQQFIKLPSGKFLISGIGLPLNVAFNPTCDIICVLSGRNLIRQRGFMFNNGGAFQQWTEFKSCVNHDGTIVSAAGVGDSIVIIKMDSLLNISSTYIVDDNVSTISAIVNTVDGGFILMLNKLGTSVFLKYDSLGQSVCGQLPYSGDSIVQIPMPMTTTGSILQKPSSIISDSLSLSSTNYSYSLSDYCIPLSIKNNYDKKYSIFPNPSNGIINILVPNVEPYEIVVLNVHGNVIIHDFSSGDYNFDASILSAAVYFIRIKSKSDVIWLQFIKE